MMKKKAVVLTDGILLPGEVLSAVQKKYGVLLDDLNVVTNSCTLLYGRMPADTASADVIVSLAATPGRHTMQFLVELARILRHGGEILIQEPIGRRQPAPAEVQKVGPTQAAAVQSQAALQRSLLLAGFTDATPIPEIAEALLAKDWMGITPASVGQTQGALLQPFAITAQKPSWSGSSFSLKSKAKVVQPAKTAEAQAGPSGVVRLTGLQTAAANGNDPMEDEDEIIDDDTLLTEEDLARPEPPAAGAEDCGAGKSGRKACANCTCGRAEMEAKEGTDKVTLDMLNNPESACGSCGLGDAFRCAGCPYRGLPPFKLGEKITLSSKLLVADT